MGEPSSRQPPFSEFPQPADGYFTDMHNASPDEHPFDLSGRDSEDQGLYDITTPTLKELTPGSSRGMSESERHDNAKFESRHRRPRPTTNNSAQRQSQPQQSPSAYSQSPSENGQNRPPTNFQQGSSAHYPSTPLTYAQGPGYVAQYTMPNQPSPVAMTSSPFTYYHPQMVADSNMVSQNIHGSYPTMLQPVYPYQGERVPSSHPSFSGTRSSFSPRQGNTSSSSSSTHLPLAGQASSPVYVAPGAFQSLPYPSPIPAPPYGYPPQTFSPSPIYQSTQFAPSSFSQHYPQGQETEPHGTWFYLPHPSATSHSPHQAGPSYQGHYVLPYQQSGGADGTYHHSDPSIGGEAHSPYPETPSHSQFSDEHFPESPHVAPTGHSIASTSVPRPASASSGSGRHVTSERPMVRRSWHPNPPAHRSEWVMWAGNVPSDATHDELWRFFNQDPANLPPAQRPSSRSTTARSPAPPTPASDSSPLEEGDLGPGVLSIFLIARSNCAFVNYVSERLLQRAITTFDGLPLRPADPRCPRLVCRVRARDDDLRAGVGAQRGMGMHTKWIKDQKAFKAAAPPATNPVGGRGALNAGSSSGTASTEISASGDEDDWRGKEDRHAKHGSSSGSYASTNSGFLAKHYPRRYFILKSLTQEDLDISVKAGVWATQKHNEEILDQAYRTSQEVNLIFSVNKSREFYGYARMIGPVLRGEKRTAWASRSSRSSISPSDQRNSSKTIFTPQPGRQVASPLSVTHEPAGDGRNASTSIHEVIPHGALTGQPHRNLASAPALLGEKYRLPTITTPAAHYSLDHRRLARHQFPLDPEAPVRAMRINQQLEDGTSEGHEGPVEVPRPDAPPRARTSSGLQSVKEEQVHGAGTSLEGIPEATSQLSLQEDTREGEGEGVHKSEIVVENGGKDVQDGGTESWGDSFAVEWLCTDRVSFNRTRHLRNPWNHDKEVKVSRDGTEMEPTVGQQLLDEWSRLAADSGVPSTPSSTPGAGRGGGGGGRGAQGPRQNLAVEASGATDGVASGKDVTGGGRGARGREGGQSRP
ncbi:hypothetical protein D9619_012686 [Psilocybe cf. subviscida]|uniref:YTH domain-containing protein n=1 Tax=Psilocybe cf. subviscida TaxID=2480587 RepID=A0A8H5B6X0_9AGAR|nr:hypothetical protein D9619_012686 [Psilocybe cf. subviscida]